MQHCLRHFRQEYLNLVDSSYTEDTLQLSRQASFDVFLEVMPNGVVVVDDTGTILHANAPIEVMFGYKRHELVGQPMAFLVPDTQRQKSHRRRSPALANRDTDGVAAFPELVGRAKNGHEFPVDITLNSMDMEGKHHTVAVIRDVSVLVQERERNETLLRFIHHRLIEGEERERQKLAQDVHDNPLQEVHSLDFRLVALTRQIDTVETRLHLQELHTTIQQISHQLRDLCQELRPPTLSTFGISTAIRSLVHSLQQQQPDLQILLELTDDEQRLSQPKRLMLYRICQHVFQNVVQHADAQSVCIRLQLLPDHVILEIEDEGSGFVVPRQWIGFARKDKFGLIECAERAQAVGGRLDVFSTPGEGTRVSVTVPLDTPEPIEGENGPDSRRIGG